MKEFLKLCITAAIAVMLSNLPIVHAQTGQVIFMGATSGTTLATNCPTAPATPSLCLVGNGIYAYENSTTGWFELLPGGTGTVTSVTINGTTKQGPAPVFTITGNTTVNAPAVTATATAPTGATIIAAQ